MTEPTKPEWLNLQELAATIYKELAPGASVIHDDHIAGKSGINRQIDVSIRSQVAGHHLLTVVDTKDLGRPVEIGDVDEFASVVDDVSANKGVLISRHGYTEGARRSAILRGLDLCRAHDSKSRKWNQDIEVPILWRERLPEVNFNVIASFMGEDSFPSNPKEWVISVGEDRSRRVLLGETFENNWNAEKIPTEPGGPYRLTDPLAATAFMLVIDKAGQIAWRTVTELALTYSVTEKVYLGHIKPVDARGILHESGAFIASHLGEDGLPEGRDPNWPLVDPDALPISVPGAVIVSTSWQVAPGSARYDGAHLVAIDLFEQNQSPTG